MRLDAMPEEEMQRFCDYPHLYVLPPFRLEGNLYFIGNREIGCYLIDTGEGLLLIDTGYENCTGQYFNSLWSLGFRPEQVRWIFHTHNHPDHMAATNLLKRLSGAKTYMSRIDGEAIQSELSIVPKSLAFTPDVLLEDGDTLTFGNTTIHCVLTPGHTRGCMSFFFNVTCEDGTQYTAAIHGGIGINTLHRKFMEMTSYMEAREDFFAHIQRIIDWPVDIYLGSHTFQNYTEEKLARRAADPVGPNPFIDPTEWHTILSIAWEMGHELAAQEP